MPQNKASLPILFDTHTHLDSPEFDQDREQVIEHAYANGVHYMVNIGAVDKLNSAHRSIKLAERYPFIWASVGLHPHDASHPIEAIAELRELASHPKVVAIGETGLDFFRDWSPQDSQKNWFRAQIKLALELKKPLIIHSRNAAADCLRILREEGASEVGGVFHCFSENAAFAEAARNLNFLFSITGIVTFKNAHTLQDTVQKAPSGSFMLETDSPYLAPHPRRGKRCESGFITFTADRVAKIRETTMREIAQETTETALAFFKIEPE